MTNITEKYGDAVNTVTDLISSKKEFIFKQTINIVLVFVIMFVFGCFDFMHATFHWEYLADQDYWVSVTMKTIGDVCAFNIGINLLIDDAIKRNKVLARLKEIYENLNKYREKDFDGYVDNIYNKEQRIEAYKNQIDFHIRALNKVSRAKDRILYSSDDPNKQEIKKTNKYCIHRARLEELKSDEFIEKNYENLSVYYKNVDPAVFGVELDGSQKIKQNKVTGSIVKGQVKASATTILSVMTVSMFFGSIMLQPDTQELEEGVIAAMNWVLRAVADIGVILWQLFRGTFTAPKIVSSQLTVPCGERVKILKSYFAWRQENGKSVPEYYTKLIKGEVEFECDKDSTIVEITPDQLKKITENHNEQVQ